MNLRTWFAYFFILSFYLILLLELTSANSSKKSKHSKKAKTVHSVSKKPLGRMLKQKYIRTQYYRTMTGSATDSCAQPPSIAPFPCSCGTTKSYENSTKSPYGASYIIGKTKVTFIQAIEECRKSSMVGLSIDFPKENEFIKSQVKDLDGDVWTSGISTKGPKQIFWTGTVTFLHYYPPEWTRPNNTGNANCLAVKPSGEWTFKNCQDKCYFFCEQINV